MGPEAPERGRPGQADAERRIASLVGVGGTFVAAVQATRVPMVVTDPAVAGNPIIFANAAFLELCGYALDEILGANYLLLVGDGAKPELVARARAAMAAHQDLIEEVAFRRKDGRQICVAAFISPVIQDGRIVQHFASFLDISDRVALEHELKDAKANLESRVIDRTRALQAINARLETEIERRSRLEQVLRDTLQQREEDLRYQTTLAREIDHRTKNALQAAASMLLVQAGQSRDPAVTDALTAATGRLERMADVHALLYQERQPDIVDISAYLRRLATELGAALQPAPGQVAVEVDADRLSLPAAKAVSVGLFVGEALTNSMKHGFPAGGPGRVTLSLRQAAEGLVRVEVEDDGAGLPAGDPAGDPAGGPAGGIGLRLMEAFADRLGGQLSVGPGRTRGTRVSLAFRGADVVPQTEKPALGRLRGAYGGTVGERPVPQAPED